MKISAVIVTYNADPNIVEASLARLREQVSRVFVVENGSANTEEIRRVVVRSPIATLIEHAKNVGIAAGLNAGVARALEEASEWVLTLDDDSLIPPGMIEAMLETWRELPEAARKSVSILAPNYSTLKGAVYPYRESTIVPTAITSGQLVHADLYRHIGFYEEKLFIDCVDHEFCFRAKEKGFQTLLVPRVVLEQRIGNPVLKSFLGKKFIVPHHRPFRYYYTFRNSIYLYRNYWCIVPGWIFRNIITNALILAKMVLLEDNKRAKIAMTFRGISDGLRGRYGMLNIRTMQRL